jgi:hypothetical protein
VKPSTNSSAPLAPVGMPRQPPERAPLFVGQGRHCTLVNVSRVGCSFQPSRQVQRAFSSAGGLWQTGLPNRGDGLLGYLSAAGRLLGAAGKGAAAGAPFSVPAGHGGTTARRARAYCRASWARSARSGGRADRSCESIKKLRYVFPNGAGRVENHGNIINRGACPPRSPPASPTP